MNAGSKWQAPGNIYLIGFMAAGKTTVGKILAANLNWPFCDTDEMIERLMGRTIADIFAEKGESHFREIESTIVGKVVRSSRTVVALGGGAVLKSENWQAICNSGATIYLKWRAPVLVKRLVNSLNRPLIYEQDEASQRKKIVELLKNREHLYRRAQHTIVCSESMTPQDVAMQILNLPGKN